ncbi:unnamed protein product [Eruca vesicaria subsp. sativa]|uniref:NOSIC domain-containing protein n=1 Tax=Eruca vesicaria subsp. sativa TaxID=29727 RepID=A0ABC8LU06_ERUVS|nr:unnamed protein product [Eruca vesicaria subsp. sativa]
MVMVKLKAFDKFDNTSDALEAVAKLLEGAPSKGLLFIWQVDTMIIQAIGLLDDLDKELNTYAMRVREWYGWHFPELAKIISENILYAKSDKLMGNRVNAAKLDFSEVKPQFNGFIIDCFRAFPHSITLSSQCIQA